MFIKRILLLKNFVRKLREYICESLLKLFKNTPYQTNFKKLNKVLNSKHKEASILHVFCDLSQSCGSLSLQFTEFVFVCAEMDFLPQSM